MKYKLVYCFKLSADMTEGGIRELMYDMDRPEFMEREWNLVCIGTTRLEFMIVQLD